MKTPAALCGGGFLFRFVARKSLGYNEPNEEFTSVELMTADSPQKLPGYLERFGPTVVLLLLFLLPLWFLPVSFFPLSFGKTALAGYVVFILAGCFLLKYLISGSVPAVRSPVLFGALALPALYLLAAWFSSARNRSLVGEEMEVDTVFFLIIAALFLFSVSFLLRTKKDLFRACLAVFFSFLVLSLYQALLIFGGTQIFSMGVFLSPAATPFGSWIDLGAFAGLIALLSVAALEFLPMGLAQRFLLYVPLGVALFFLALTNNPETWLVLSVSAGLLAILRASDLSKSAKVHSVRQIPFHFIAMVCLSVFFIFGGYLLSDPLNKSLGISWSEPRPSWQGTYRIAGETLRESPWLGTGPNTFEYEWRKHKPPEVNISQFWNLDFKGGVGIWPTALVSTGFLGGFAWLLFLISVLWLGFQALQRHREDFSSYFLSVMLSGGSLYFVLLFITYAPAPGLFLLAFAFFGLSVSLSRLSEGGSEKEIAVARNPLLGFVSITLLIILLSGVVWGLYILSKKTLDLLLTARASQVYSRSQDVAGAETFLAQAERVSESDAHYRALSDLKLIVLSNLFKEARSLPEEAVRVQLQALLREAIGYGQKAVNFDPLNYRNHLTLARAYESVVPLKVTNAYENASSTYLSAQQLAPRDPGLELTMARLEILNGTLDMADFRLNRALTLKPNYTEAVFLKSQLESLRGNIPMAIAAAEAAVAISPEPTLYFQLGLLRYHAKQYAEAREALGRAVALEPNYANAHYFLGLSYSALGEKDKAIAEFRLLRASNPENEEVNSILLNLKAGREPFEQESSPEAKKPEKRPRLPLPEAGTERGTL